MSKQCHSHARFSKGYYNTTILLFVFVFYYWMKSVDSTKIRSYHTKNTIQNDGEEKKKLGEKIVGSSKQSLFPEFNTTAFKWRLNSFIFSIESNLRHILSLFYRIDLKRRNETKRNTQLEKLVPDRILIEFNLNYSCFCCCFKI